MTERGILFSAPMVRALLDGSKTQTRRAVKLPVEYDAAWRGGWKIVHSKVTQTVEMFNELRGRPLGCDVAICPYGQPGDRLWVRETWADLEQITDGCFARQAIYRADDIEQYGNEDEFVDVTSPDMRWRPSIHMPRWASRILLEITGVRVERLHDISDQDAIAEGISRVGPGWERWHPDPADTEHTGSTQDPRLSYRGLWESINGAGSWDANPWVWVVEFKRVRP